jgi:hypothetical protein
VYAPLQRYFNAEHDQVSGQLFAILNRRYNWRCVVSSIDIRFVSDVLVLDERWCMQRSSGQ